MKIIKIISVCLFFLLIASGLALAGEWEIKGGIMPMVVNGTRHVGDIYTMNNPMGPAIVNNAEGPYLYDYDVTYEPINAKTGLALAYYGSVGYMGDNQWGFRAHKCHINTLLLGKVSQPGQVIRCQIYAGGNLCYSAVARRAVDLINYRTLVQFPGKCVLAATGANN